MASVLITLWLNTMDFTLSRSHALEVNGCSYMICIPVYFCISQIPIENRIMSLAWG